MFGSDAVIGWRLKANRILNTEEIDIIKNRLLVDLPKCNFYHLQNHGLYTESEKLFIFEKL